MRQVRPKKYLGQHFLKDQEIARRIADALEPAGKYRQALEIGPGMGVLTRYLLERDDLDLKVIEIDQESVAYLKEHFPILKDGIIEGDFLNINPNELFEGPFAIIGNFPYNISSQILFRALEFRDRIPEMAGMFQKEVAERIASPPGSRHYGILSVLLQAYYDIEYLFTVDEHVFDPPPKVKSGVIRLKRNDVLNLPCDEKSFIKVVKAGFNQRRKTLRNALSQILPKGTESPLLSLRAERLSVADFVELTLLAEKL